jgi:membrane-associated phospholipid phosphatase
LSVEFEVHGFPVPVTRIILGVGLVALLVLLSPSYFGWALAVGATIVAVPIRRIGAYAAAFLPYGAAWLIFTVLRSAADETAVPIRTEAVTGIERALFFGVVPTIWLQQHLYDPLNLRWYDYLTTFIHWSYFFVPHVAAVILWRKNRDLFQRYLVSMVLLLGIGLLIYFLSPAAPPWLTADRAPEEDIYRVMAVVGRDINSSLYNRTNSVVGDSNPIAAMPSMHQAVTFLVTLFALKAGRVWGTLGLLYGVAMAYSLVYTGEHYVIDTLVGSALAVYCYYVSGKWLGLVRPILQIFGRDRVPHRQAPSIAA